MSESISQITQTICNALWGNQLSFHPFTCGDAPVQFSSLWPNKDTLVETYTDANIEQAPYELCKLLVASNSFKSVDALLEERILQVDQRFNPGGVTLAHLACAVGVGEVLQVLVKRSQVNHGVWGVKDEEDYTPLDMCFRPELKRFLPGQSIFGKRRKVPHGLPLKMADRDRIFEIVRSPENYYQIVVLLQTYSFDVNHVRSKEGNLLIHEAVKGGLPQLPLLFTLTLNFKADVTLLTKAGLSPLCLACKRGEERIAEILVCVFGVNINKPTASNGRSPLHWAVENNHPAVVSMLLRRGADPALEDIEGRIPSFVARRHRYHECKQIITQFLMERVARLGQQATDGTLNVDKLYKSDATIVTSTGCTLLMLATQGNHPAIVEKLVKMENCPLDFKQMKSCDLFESDEFGSSMSYRDMVSSDSEYSLKTAVHIAAENGYIECLQALLNAGANPAISDASAMLPLHSACENGHLVCVSAIVNFPTQQGLCRLQSALNIARGNDFDSIVTLLEEAMKRRQTDLVNPLLFEVATSGSNELLFAVLENGDDVNPVNEFQDWPLLLAAGGGHLDLVQQLHACGGHVTRKHQIYQTTPLHVAAKGGHAEVVKYLLGFCMRADGTIPPSSLPTGATIVGDLPPCLYINDRNTAGCTPLELAVQQGHRDVVRLLMEHGASTTLPDSNGCQLNCSSFAGTQFLMETHRKNIRKDIIACFKNPKATLKDLQKTWGGPSDFNLSKRGEDSLLMMAAQYARPDILQFLIDEASKCRRGMLISPGQPLQSNGLITSSAEESSPGALESSLPPNFKHNPFAQQAPNPFDSSPTQAPKNPFDNAPPNPFDESTKPEPSPKTGGTPDSRKRLSPVRSIPKDTGVPQAPQTALPRVRREPEVTITSLGPTPPAFPQTALPTVHSRNKSVTGVRFETSLPSSRNGGAFSEPCDEQEKELVDSRSLLPTVVRTQARYQTETGSSRRAPKKPPRAGRQRTQSDMPPRPSGLGKRKAESNATPASDVDHPRLKPVVNGHGGVSSGTESGPEGKGRECIKLLHYANPSDGCTALHRAAEHGRADNVSVLLTSDEELANMTDYVGNTALHLACLRAHKQTVRVLLNFKCVSTIIRNIGQELPEDRCMKRDIRKMVSKERQLVHGNDPANWGESPKRPQGMASVEQADYTKTDTKLSDIREVPPATGGPIVEQPERFQEHFQHLKDEFDKLSVAATADTNQ